MVPKTASASEITALIDLITRLVSEIAAVIDLITRVVSERTAVIDLITHVVYETTAVIDLITRVVSEITAVVDLITRVDNACSLRDNNSHRLGRVDFFKKKLLPFKNLATIVRLPPYNVSPP